MDDDLKIEDEEKQLELTTLKRLQSGLAAKARECLGKKVISPIKMRIEKREEVVELVNEVVQLPKEKSPSPPALQIPPPIQSPVSSRSPSPALPLTREEAMKMQPISECKTQTLTKSPLVERSKSR